MYNLTPVPVPSASCVDGVLSRLPALVATPPGHDGLSPCGPGNQTKVCLRSCHRPDREITDPVGRGRLFSEKRATVSVGLPRTQGPSDGLTHSLRTTCPQSSSHASQKAESTPTHTDGLSDSTEVAL